MMKLSKPRGNHTLYENFSGLYEFIFKPFFIGAIKKTMVRVKKLRSESIVEVGVGTGYSLDYYPKGTSVIGLDVSNKMVQLSRRRALEIKDKNIEIYNIYDLADGVLDEVASVVVSFSVITVVPDPQAFLESLKTYCMPGGSILMIMHSRGTGLNGVIDRFLDGITQKLFGFTLLRDISDYNLEGLELVESKPISKILFYPYNHLIVLRKK